MYCIHQRINGKTCTTFKYQILSLKNEVYGQTENRLQETRKTIRQQYYLRTRKKLCFPSMKMYVLLYTKVY